MYVPTYTVVFGAILIRLGKYIICSVGKEHCGDKPSITPVGVG
jgi:hypothetical protein